MTGFHKTKIRLLFSEFKIEIDRSPFILKTDDKKVEEILLFNIMVNKSQILLKDATILSKTLSTKLNVKHGNKLMYWKIDIKKPLWL